VTRRWHVEVQRDDGNLICHADVTVRRVADITATVTANNTARIDIAGHLTAAAVGHTQPGARLHLYRWPAGDTSGPAMAVPVAPVWEPWYA
jgi:hypothetical protein